MAAQAYHRCHPIEMRLVALPSDTHIALLMVTASILTLMLLLLLRLLSGSHSVAFALGAVGGEEGVDGAALYAQVTHEAAQC